MTKLILASILALSLTACTTRTSYGECVGLISDKKPNLEYKLSIWNTVLAIIFSETIVVPVVVLADNIQCPVGTK